MPLHQRHDIPEVLDQPGVDHAQHIRALEGLSTINFWSGSAQLYWPALRKLAMNRSAPLRVLDLATGGGDVPCRLWHWARREGLEIQVAGCDVSSVAIQHAQQKAKRWGAEVDFFKLDAREDPLPTGHDVLICSLFLHHLDEQGAVSLLRGMGQAAREGILVNDLRRSWQGLTLAHLAARVLSRSWIVHVDGPRSVRRAFTPAEVCGLAEQAGLSGARVSCHWPFRLLLSWSRS